MKRFMVALSETIRHPENYDWSFFEDLWDTTKSIMTLWCFVMLIAIL